MAEATENARDPQVARTLLANDRTYLAWVRTSLALVAAGVASSKFLPPVDVLGGRRVLGGVLVCLGAAVGAMSYARWRTNDQLIRAGGGIVRGAAPQLLAAIVALTVAVGFVLAVVSAR